MHKASILLDLVSALLDLAPSVAKAPLADALHVKKQGVCVRKLEENCSHVELRPFCLPRGKKLRARNKD